MRASRESYSSLPGSDVLRTSAKRLFFVQTFLLFAPGFITNTPVGAGQSASDNIPIGSIELRAGRYDLEQRALSFDDGEMLRGAFDVNDFLQNNPEFSDRVLELWELYLCVWNVVDPERRKNVPAVHDLIMKHMTWVRQRVSEFYAQRSVRSLQLTEEDATEYWTCIKTPISGRSILKSLFPWPKVLLVSIQRLGAANSL
ncbi:hypothetical protein EJ03DRAFT_166848 [Teratosphaeria nubilosa]|uniref:Uncharacterized protein n=1 Tax=Teratosphaeria nubilosa TaxID=161662 RepID=A0A6G1L1M3_9PEZI|nr:hypothetical protein EJ03DRAFT_166848 [Teratosphaeria nubilosa]